MRFWENHAKEMRRARLLQAAAVVYVNTSVSTPNRKRSAVQTVLELETLIDEKLSEKSAYQRKTEIVNE